MKDNYIIGIINAIRKNITRRILNSCKENEEEIKDCDIFINDKKKILAIIINFQIKENIK